MIKEQKDPHPNLPPVRGKELDIPPPERGRLGGGQKFRELSLVTINRSRALRKDMTEAEKKLWRHVRLRQLNGDKFRRQHAIGSYIVDFVCIEKKLIIELDGGQHALKENYDKRRTKYLEEMGYRVVRFWNNDVIENIEAVVVTIQNNLDPHLTSPLQGEECKEPL